MDDYLICPFCNTPHPREARFCTNTGKLLPQPLVSLAPESSSPPAERIFCTNCGASLPKIARFCTVCGIKLLSPQPASPKEQEHAPEPKHRISPLIWAAIAVSLVLFLAFVVIGIWLMFPGLITSITGVPLPDPPPIPFIKTNTPTFTITPSSTLTPLPLPTDTPTLTLQKTATPTSTITPAPTETERKACPGAPPIRVEIGDAARVIVSQVYARSNPVVATNIDWYFFQGNTIKILAGPVCSNDVSFFKAQEASTGHIGWIAEAEADTRNYYIEPVP